MNEPDHIRGFKQRFATATPGDPFEEWYFAMARYYGRRVEPEVMERYRRLLTYRDDDGRKLPIPIPELEAVLDEYIEDVLSATNRLPHVNEIKDRWHKRKRRQREAIAEKNAPAVEPDYEKGHEYIARALAELARGAKP